MSHKNRIKFSVGLTRLLASILAICLMMALVALPGCDNSKVTAGDGNDPAGGGQTQEPQIDPMADRSITDVGGREVTVPGVGALKSIYYTGATAEIFCFTLAPELAGGTTYEWTAPELELLPKEMATLKYLGTQSGGKQLNLEAIMAEDIQLIFACPVAAPTDKDISDCDDLQNQTGIPVILLNGSLEKVGDTYRLLGDILGREAEAEKLAAYCEDRLKAVTTPKAQRGCRPSRKARRMPIPTSSPAPSMLRRLRPNRGWVCPMCR